MSYGAFVQADIDDKTRQGRKLTEAEQRREERYGRARNLVADRLPELNDGREGHPCPFAVWAVLDLWRKHGEGNAKPSQIRTLRAARLKAHQEWLDSLEPEDTEVQS